jgi:hypothetical protein
MTATIGPSAGSPAAPGVRDRVGAASRRSSERRLILLGGFAGLAWAAGLRGFMAQVTPESSVHWAGTFGYILAPGLAIGGLLGWAEHLRRTGGRRGWCWLALAPLLFTAVLLSRPLDILSVFADGIGGGALGIPLLALAGGYAMSGRGPVIARLICGIVALTPVPIWILTVTSFAGPDSRFPPRAVRGLRCTSTRSSASSWRLARSRTVPRVMASSLRAPTGQ